MKQINNNFEIPSNYIVGGQNIEVSYPKEIKGDKLGEVCILGGFLHIAETSDSIAQSKSSMENTFVHELVHSVLDTMGEFELSRDEKFVCCFSGFLLEALKSFKYENNSDS